MKFAKLIPCLCAGAVILASQSSAFASSVQTSVTAEFSNIIARTDTSFRVSGNEHSGRATLTWQNGQSDNSSRITFDGYRLPGQGNHDFSGFDHPFALGKLSFKNGASSGLPGISSADLTVSFLWGDVDMSPVDMVFGLNLSEQAISHGKGHKSNQGDLLILSPTTESVVFNTDIGKYRLDLLGWSKDGGRSFVDSLFAADHSIRHVNLYAMLQAVSDNPSPPPAPQAVPVPAAVWLFGSGLVALTGLSRRHRVD